MKMGNILGLTALCALSLAMVASATDWTAGTGAWETAGNWNAGLPSSTVSGAIINGGTAQSTAAGNAVKYFTVGSGSGNGTLNISAGKLTAAASTYIANGGTGTINVSGGAAMDAQFMGVGFGAGGTGHLSVSGSASSIVDVYNGLTIGYNGVGSVTIDQGKITTHGGADTYIGRNAGSDGTLTLKNGGRLYTGGLRMADNANATATINVEPGGYLSIPYYLYAGYNGTASIVQTGGDIVVGGSSSGLAIAGYNGSTGSYTISGGTLAASTSATDGSGAFRLGGWSDSYTGAGTFTVVGSDATISMENYNQSSSGTLVTEIDGTGISLIDVNGTGGNGIANLDGVFNIVDSGAANGTYDIITATTINGDFDSVTVGGVDIDTLPDWSYAINGGTLSVTVIPEPATLGMVAMLGVSMLWIRRQFLI